MSLKYGRKPARFTYASTQRGRIIADHFKDLGPAPVSSPDWVTAVTHGNPTGWGMDSNDTYGDCVIADCVHQEMLRTANVGGIWVPTALQYLALYAYFQGMAIDPNGTLTSADLTKITSYLSNYDNGCDELTVINYLTQTGWLGHKLSGHANLNPLNLDQIKWSVCIFGASRLGVNLPDSAMNQFESGKPWDYVANASLDGGHDVPVVKYDADGIFWVVTWGKLQPVTPAFMKGKYADGTPYVEEAHAELALDWINSMGTSPSKFNLQELLDKLNDVTAPPAPVPTPPAPPVTTSKKELGILLLHAISANIKDPKVTEPQMKADIQSILNAN